MKRSTLIALDASGYHPASVHAPAGMAARWVLD